MENLYLKRLKFFKILCREFLLKFVNTVH